MQSSLVNSEIMGAMLDPVSFERFKNPIMCPHGHTFESGTLLSKTTETGAKMLQCATTGVYFPESEYRKNYLVADLTKLICEILEKLNKENLTYEEISSLREQLRTAKSERDIYKDKYEKLTIETQKNIQTMQENFDKRIKYLESQVFFKDPTIQKFIFFISATGYIAYKFFTSRKEET